MNNFVWYKSSKLFCILSVVQSSEFSHRFTCFFVFHTEKKKSDDRMFEVGWVEDISLLCMAELDWIQTTYTFFGWITWSKIYPNVTYNVIPPGSAHTVTSIHLTIKTHRNKLERSSFIQFMSFLWEDFQACQVWT